MSALGAGYNIGGNLTFGGGGGNAFMGLGGTPSQSLNALGQDYNSAYQSALNINRQNYGNILAGYQQLMAQQVPAEANITQGYTNLENQVLGTIKNIGASAGQQIQDLYAQQTGATQQQLINSGLGNSTVLASAQRGNTLDYAKAQVALQNQVAGLTAGYQSNLGLAGLNYQNQALMQNTGLGLQQLNFMNSVQAPYPNGAMYGGLAQGIGSLQAALAAKGMLGGMRGPTGYQPFGPIGGYSPTSLGGQTYNPGYGDALAASVTNPYAMGGGQGGSQSGWFGGGGDFGGAYGNNQYSGGMGEQFQETSPYDLSAGVGTA
jgi:hypothetical protein